MKKDYYYSFLKRKILQPLSTECTSYTNCTYITYNTRIWFNTTYYLYTAILLLYLSIVFRYVSVYI